MTTPSEEERLKDLVNRAKMIHPGGDDYNRQIRDALREASQEEIGEATIKALREATAEPTQPDPENSSTRQ